jgi:hypoxia up-regulated 1
MKVLGVVSDSVAVGINYAVSRTFPDITKNGKAEINMVFDMGAGSTSATVLQFAGRSVKDVGKRNKTIQEVQVLGVGWDRTLGGDALNSLIVEDMVSSCPPHCQERIHHRSAGQGPWTYRCKAIQGS